MPLISASFEPLNTSVLIILNSSILIEAFGKLLIKESVQVDSPPLVVSSPLSAVAAFAAVAGCDEKNLVLLQSRDHLGPETRFRVAGGARFFPSRVRRATVPEPPVIAIAPPARESRYRFSHIFASEHVQNLV